jgi:hypothetical protein
VDLQTIVDRIAEGLTVIDAQDEGGRFNRRTGEPYLKGLKTMSEHEVTTALVKWWPNAHPGDFGGRLEAVSEVPYPNSPRDRCDIFIRENGTEKPVWAIEVKHIALVGDNGKNNDYGVTKMLSPYLKDRSLRHDMIRLRDSGFECRSASVVYSFSYTPNSIKEASSRYPMHADRIREMDRVRASAQDEKGEYSIAPMVSLATHMLKTEGLVGETAEAGFSGAWAHPCGGQGIVAGWRVSLGDGERRGGQ